MTIELGILLALFCAFATNLAFLLKHRGACAAPDVSLSHPVASAVGLFRSKWFALGMLVAFGAWALHVFALALAPLSLVQAVISGGYSLTMQAMQLGFSPRMRIYHTSRTEYGQIYIPAVNWALLIGCIIIVFAFRSSTHLAAGVLRAATDLDDP